ncbi:L,D-transpeptidase family protein [Ferruginibacter lapsinanis]|uniref:L,D-transpeptidase family protein n=1 Tax=Ferruginibacter lapsinanis TaxID=563172 RepID=UPI001E479ADA|nr:L,D-transpeptidase family protein [Ferruginibacter lapsinanis]UEG49008.1 L,D-transpeptidase family protein [Ferruginibacter lapsinanis]
MNRYKSLTFLFAVLLFCVYVSSCNNSPKKEKKDTVTTPDKIDVKTAECIKQSLAFAMLHRGAVNDSVRLKLTLVVNDFYENNHYANIWSKKEKWEPLADTLFEYIKNAELNGLFPNDYHFKNLHALKNLLDADSVKRMDALLWSNADLMLTDGLMLIMKDLKDGRLLPDSISLNPDSVLAANFFVENLNQLLVKKQFSSLLNTIEPKHKGYWRLKTALKKFVDSMDRKEYTYVKYPYKKNDEKDSLLFIKMIQRRLNESYCIDFINKMPDSLQLSTAIKKYQKQKGIKQDGIITGSIVNMMNNTDTEKFKRIAITLDRYKQLPVNMPEKYIWVNLPGYYLQVWDHDTLALESRIICGKPATRTPLLNSYITDMVTYPTWTVPTSIIVKQYLPKLKNNPSYISKLGLKLMNAKGETIDPSSVSWSKYSKGIPYKIMQNSGDNNALGVFKFNFDNEYAVYLHDTNQRYLFKNASRAFSHGCVRVQEWEKLAYYIARNDSLNVRPGDTLRYTTDSIKNWIAAKQRKRIDVKNKVALYIRYFSCDEKDGSIKFYDDIYGEDKLLREKYFSNK